MIAYILRRLLLFPITLFGILFFNFLLLNLAPGEPTTRTELSSEGASRQQTGGSRFDDPYAQFREHYGLTLPLFWNLWPNLSYPYVETTLRDINDRPPTAKDNPLPQSQYQALRRKLSDQARFVMPHLLQILANPNESLPMRALASRFFAKGGFQFAHVGARITSQERQENRKIAADNQLLLSLILSENDDAATIERKVLKLQQWYDQERLVRQWTPTWQEKIRIFFTQTRFARYTKRLMTLNFGTLRGDTSRNVVDEVLAKLPFSLALTLPPMLLTFFLSLAAGLLMATFRGKFLDWGSNFLFLFLYALPIFVVAPFLIEYVALGGTFPGTKTPIPLGEFHSPEALFSQMSSWDKIIDVMQHLFLPWIALLYGSVAVQARLTRTAVLDVLHHDFIRTAKAKGVPKTSILFHHVGRSAAIPLVTSLAASLSGLLAGSLIIETLFNIHGFGLFFYQATLQWDYNVLLFSTLATSLLALFSYLIADLLYTFLDPRVQL